MTIAKNAKNLAKILDKVRWLEYGALVLID
jgi:hypothetical protein